MFGICYYPEHWSREIWLQDAKMMCSLGIEYVRIGEFAWSRIEPRSNEFCFEWLDDAITILCDVGLKVILGTPTATPPKWLVDQYPEILPVDVSTGRVRGFGSRRHYDFSSAIYLREALRITELLVKRYGQHKGVVGWQTDNELCCHETALSASKVACDEFQKWCNERYMSIDDLNKAWGNVFWSMEYNSFSQIELPVGAVTELNPAHSLAYRRFSSEKVVNFHNRMIEIIRMYAPGKFITHNFIPMNETGVDNYALAKSLDFASYDNYPLGRTDLHFTNSPATDIQKYMRTGHPDFATYYHDQTRCLNKEGDGFWVMEQQPGPVNWAQNNPRPASGMVRLWTLEALAHGAACVCYFRWRQAPFGQEQMHAGLLRVDNSKTEAWEQIEQVREEVLQSDILKCETQRAPVAIITSAEAQWVSDIECQGESYDFNQVQFSYYSALREIGVNVDFISVDDDFSNYSIIIAPSLPIIDDEFVDKCDKCDAMFIFGPRFGAKTQEFSYPNNLPPGPLQRIAPFKILTVETLRVDCVEMFMWQGKQYENIIWREELEAPGAKILARYKDGSPAIAQYNRIIYLSGLTNTEFLCDFLKEQCQTAGIRVYSFGKNIRVRQRGDLKFAFNYSDEEKELPLEENAVLILGDKKIKPRDVTIWK